MVFALYVPGSLNNPLIWLLMVLSFMAIAWVVSENLPKLPWKRMAVALVIALVLGVRVFALDRPNIDCGDIPEWLKWLLGYCT